MPLDDKIFKELSKEEMTPLHRSLVNTCRQHLERSRANMARYYDRWDQRLQAYQAQVPKERRKDEYADEEQRPASQTIPMTFAQVQTFKAYATAVLDQRALPYEHNTDDPEDAKWMTMADEILALDLRTNNWQVKRGQFLTNLGIMGVGVLKHSWLEEYQGISVETTEGGTMAFNQVFGAQKKIISQKVLTRKGNDIMCLSPFRWFPDPTYDLHDFQRGEFCASEHEYSRSWLEGQEKLKEIAGLEFVPCTFPSETWDKDRSDRSKFTFYRHDQVVNKTVVVDEVQLKIIPSLYKLDDGTPLGDSDVPVLMKIWLANDARIVKLELMNYAHGKFTYDACAFDNEQHTYIGKTISDLMAQLQETIDWFLNARVEAVTRNVDAQLIADPAAVEIEDLKNRARVIRIKKGAARGGIERFVKQLAVQDPTLRHMEDIRGLTSLTQMILGQNDNMLGQFHSGRRSATEARVVASGASARATVIVKEIWSTALEPAGQKYLSNLRQGLNKEDIIRMVGNRPDEIIAAFLAPPDQLVRNFDSFAFDATTSGEKAFMAQMMMELIQPVISNPEASVTLNLSPRLLLEKVFELQGIKFKNDIGLDKDPQQLQKIIMQTAQQLAQQMVMQFQQQQPTQQNGPGAAA